MHKPMYDSDSLCLGYDKPLCNTCERKSPEKLSDKHLLFRPMATDKKCELYRRKK